MSKRLTGTSGVSPIRSSTEGADTFGAVHGVTSLRNLAGGEWRLSLENRLRDARQLPTKRETLEARAAGQTLPGSAHLPHPFEKSQRALGRPRAGNIVIYL
ncbi:hypothetical protein D3C80_1213550 [compost metagenome]